MFEFIRGTVVSVTGEYAVIDVNGVGFRIYTSITSVGGCELNKEATFWTYMSVREDDISIYGFTTQDELHIFELLITVPGVGPKMAISILSQMSVVDLKLAVAQNNKKALTAAKGVGAKLADKIIIELRDKVGAVSSDENVPQSSPSRDIIFGGSSVYDDAVEALTTLGIPLQKAKSMVGAVYQDGMELDETVKLALKG